MANVCSVAVLNIFGFQANYRLELSKEAADGWDVQAQWSRFSGPSSAGVRGWWYFSTGQGGEIEACHTHRLLVSRGTTPRTKKKQCASWDFVVCFCMRLAVCNEWCCFSLGILQYFWLFWVRKPVFFVSLSQCEHSGSIFFVLQLIGFHTCKRYCLQEKEQYVWKSDRRNAYIYIVHYLFFSIWYTDLHMYLNHKYVGFVNNTMYVIILEMVHM